MQLPDWFKGSLEPGTFLRPIGPYTYCLEVLAYSPPRFSQWRIAYSWKRTGAWDLSQYKCRRWGLRDGQPYDDGSLCYRGLGHMVNVLPGIWNEGIESRRGPYWQVIDRQQRGQLDLFAAA